MSKYITEDKIADFVTAMWKAGLRTNVNPEEKSISVAKPDGHYEFIDVYAKNSFEDLIKNIANSDVQS